MTWVKVDDKLPANLKVRSVSVQARWAYVASICYAGANRSDGFIPEASLGMVDATPKIGAELVTAGLWEATRGGWNIHDYLKYNRSKTAIESLSERNSENGAKSAAKRSTKGQRIVEPTVLSGSVSGSPTLPNPLLDPGVSTEPEGESLNDSLGFGDRYGTLTVALGGHLDRKTCDEFEQIARDATLLEIRAGIEAVRRNGKRPYPSYVWQAILDHRDEQSPAAFDLEALYEPA